MALAPKFTTSAFPIPNYFTFKNFVRSRRDWEKKCREGSLTLPLFQSLRLRKPLHSFCALLCCHAHPWGREGVGGSFAGREGGIESMKWWWCGVDDEMICFLHSWYNGVFESSRETHTAFCFAFTFRTLLCSLRTLLWKFKQKLRKSLGRLGKDENLGASWNYLRRKRK